MPLISLIIVLIVIGILLYVVEQLLPIDPTIKNIIRIVILLAVVLWLLSLVGIIPQAVHVGRVGAVVPRAA
jgi:hypothetical protein